MFAGALRFALDVLAWIADPDGSDRQHQLDVARLEADLALAQQAIAQGEGAAAEPAGALPSVRRPAPLARGEAPLPGVRPGRGLTCSRCRGSRGPGAGQSPTSLPRRGAGNPGGTHPGRATDLHVR